eukprot:406355_1
MSQGGFNDHLQFLKGFDGPPPLNSAPAQNSVSLPKLNDYLTSQQSTSVPTSSSHQPSNFPLQLSNIHPPPSHSSSTAQQRIPAAPSAAGYGRAPAAANAGVPTNVKVGLAPGVPGFAFSGMNMSPPPAPSPPAPPPVQRITQPLPVPSAPAAVPAQVPNPQQAAMMAALYQSALAAKQQSAAGSPSAAAASSSPTPYGMYGNVNMAAAQMLYQQNPQLAMQMPYLSNIYAANNPQLRQQQQLLLQRQQQQQRYMQQMAQQKQLQQQREQQRKAASAVYQNAEKSGVYRYSAAQRRSPEQQRMLNHIFEQNSHPNEAARAEIAARLGMDVSQVYNWFAQERHRRKKVEVDGFVTQSSSPQMNRNFVPPSTRVLRSDTRTGRATLEEPNSAPLPDYDMYRRTRTMYNGAQYGSTDMYGRTDQYGGRMAYGGGQLGAYGGGQLGAYGGGIGRIARDYRNPDLPPMLDLIVEAITELKKVNSPSTRTNVKNWIFETYDVNPYNFPNEFRSGLEEGAEKGKFYEFSNTFRLTGEVTEDPNVQSFYASDHDHDGAACPIPIPTPETEDARLLSLKGFVMGEILAQEPHYSLSVLALVQKIESFTPNDYVKWALNRKPRKAEEESKEKKDDEKVTESATEKGTAEDQDEYEASESEGEPSPPPRRSLRRTPMRRAQENRQATRASMRPDSVNDADFEPSRLQVMLDKLVATHRLRIHKKKGKSVSFYVATKRTLQWQAKHRDIDFHLFSYDSKEEDAYFDDSTGNFLSPQVELQRRRANNEAVLNQIVAYERREAKFFLHRGPSFKRFVSKDYLSRAKKILESEADPKAFQPEPAFEGEQVDMPKSIRATLRPYQKEGITWMVKQHDQGISAILADEMGLGKTLQSMTFLAYLKEVRQLAGPYLIVCPLNVLTMWVNEFARFCPTMRVVRFHGPEKERQRIIRDKLDFGTFDVLVTTFEMALSAEEFLKNQFVFQYIVLDEAHRIKNEEAQISESLRKIRSYGRLLLTGTPLQNNLHELWSLLNFMFPEQFDSAEPFDTGFDLVSNRVNQDTLWASKMALSPFMLRRLKSEVVDLPPKIETKILVPLSELQTFWYKRLLAYRGSVLDKGQTQLVQGAQAKKTVSQSEWQLLVSLMMQLRKCCNHPYLFSNCEPDLSTGESYGLQLISSCGKMQVLDKLLTRLKKDDHRILIFSQFTSMLDILEDYVIFRKWKFLRLDGSTNRVQRQFDIARYNKKKSEIFIFLITTRAGGLGINLHTADVVIHYDSDWNPQADLQAQDRAHRIGQTRPVHVYRLVTEGTVEERIVLRAEKKLYLDAVVTTAASTEDPTFEDPVKSEMEEKKKKIEEEKKKKKLEDEKKKKDAEEEKTMSEEEKKKKESDAAKEKKKEEKAEKDMQDEMTSVSKKEMLSMLTFGAERVFTSHGNVLTDADLDLILQRGNPNDTQSSSSKEAGTEPTEPSVDSGTTPTTTDATKAEKVTTGSDGVVVKPEKVESRLKEDTQLNVANYDIKIGPLSLREFQGKKFRAKANSVKSIAKEWKELLGKRKRESTTVNVGGHTVLKANNYSMNSEFGRAGGHISQVIVDVLFRKFSTHESTCHECKNGGKLLLCESCPRSYHLECLGLDEIPRGQFRCPQHKCIECFRPAHEAGGLLFRCIACAYCACEDHIKGNIVPADGCERLEVLGYKKPSTACYVLCSTECELYEEENITTKEELEAVARGHDHVWEKLPASIRTRVARTRAREGCSTLGELPGFEDRIRAIEPTSTILGILHDWLYGHQNHSHIYMHLSQWDGLAKDATHSDLAKFYNAVYRELRSWRDVSLLQMATILGLWTRSKPRVIRGGSLVGRMSRPKDRNLSTVDNADPIRHHIAIFLTKPHIYGQHVHYRYLSKLFDLNREETKPPQGEEAVRDQDPGDIIESMGSAEEQEEEEIEMEPIVQSEEEIDEDYAPAAPTETFEPETESAQSSSNQLKIRLRHIPSSPHFPSPRRFACVSVEGATLGKRARANTADEDDHRKRTRRIDEDEEATSSAQPTTSVSQPTFSGSMLPNQQSVSELADWTVLDGKVSLTDSPQRDFFSEQMDQSSESPYGEMGL